MVTYDVSHQAYVKIALHAAKYPHQQVNGVLLGELKGTAVSVVDAVPLLHHWTNLSPSMEIGIDLAGNHAQSLRLHLVGYYQVSERIDDTSLAPVGEKIASALKKGFPNAVAFVVDGSLLAAGKPAVIAYSSQDNSSLWRPASANATTLQSSSSPTRVLELIRDQKLHYKFGDFDDHLEDVSIDWLRNNECRDSGFIKE